MEEGNKNERIMCILIGVVFIGLGFLGMTGIVTMFENDEAFITVGQVLIGFIGIMVALYSRRAKENARQRKDAKRLRKKTIT